MKTSEVTRQDRKAKPEEEAKPQQRSNELAFTQEEESEFQRQHEIVEKGIKGFWEIGRALAVIKAGKLWRAGRFKSWEAYCRSVAGMSRGHAHRILQSTEFMNQLKTSPRGDVFPVTEAQVRPILKLPVERRIDAWAAAVEKAEGHQPTAPEVRRVVVEILHPDGSNTDMRLSRSQLRTRIATQLKDAVKERKSWDEVEKLVEQLGRVIGP